MLSDNGSRCNQTVKSYVIFQINQMIPQLQVGVHIAFHSFITPVWINKERTMHDNTVRWTARVETVHQ
jgi:hypothetical protein